MPLQNALLELINQKQVMKLVGVGSRETLDRWIRLGLFPPPIRIGGGRLRWVVAEVEGWVETKKMERAAALSAPVSAHAAVRRTLRLPKGQADASQSRA